MGGSKVAILQLALKCISPHVVVHPSELRNICRIAYVV
jgi:hypothetical protein